MALPMGTAQPKPAKGTVWREGRERRAERKAHERREMEAAKRRDGNTCRRPRCPWLSQKPRIEAAHVVAHRGMGGDPKGTRTWRQDLMALCFMCHAQFDRIDLLIEFLTERNTDDCCAFYERDDETGKFYCIGVESRIGVSVART